MTDEAAMDPEVESVAVIGMAVRCPGARTPEQLWEVLREGRETITHFSAEELRPHEFDPERTERADNYVRAKGVLEDIELFDAEFFDCSRREAAHLDPQHRIWLELVWEALERAGYCHRGYDGAVGVFAGSFTNHYLLRHLLQDRRAVEEYTRGRDSSAFAKLIDNDSGFLPTRTAYKLGLKGPAVNVQSACSTSLVAVTLAVQSLLSYESDVAVAGGICIAVPQETGYFYQEGAIASKDGHCRPYDADATGTVFSNGAGVVILKRLSEALQDGDRVLSVIRGAAINNDGADKVSFTAPSVAGQAAVIAAAQALAGVSADSISYVEGHGTATPMGDPIEVAALTRAFEHDSKRRQFCGLGSIKGNIGHLDAAAGVLGLIKVTLALQHGQLPPTVHYRAPNPEIHFDETPFYVVDRLTPWESDGPRRAGVSSFGIGGTNAHLVVEQAPDELRPDTPSPRARQLVCLSAKSREALELLQQELARSPAAACESAADIAFTLATAREPFAERRAFVFDPNAGALSELLHAPPGGSVSSGRPGASEGTLFLFPGQGSAYHSMGAELFQLEPVYRDSVMASCALAEGLLAAPLLPLLDGSASEGEFQARMDHNAVAQLAVFAVDLALFGLWQSWGVMPTALLGHSLGEWVALCAAGVLSHEDAVRAVYHRGALMEQFAGNGGAAAVRMAPDMLEAELPGGVTLAARNSPESSLLSGPREAVQAAVAALRARGVTASVLDIRVAVHSPALDAMIEPFDAVLRTLTFRPPQLPIVSTALGRTLSPEEATDPALWARQARVPVRYTDALLSIAAASSHHMLEVGPGRALTGLLRQHARVMPAQVAINALAPAEQLSEVTMAYAALGRYWASGGALDWGRYFGSEPRRRVSLPTHPMVRERHWVDAPGLSDQAPRRRDSVPPLLSSAAPARRSSPPGAPRPPRTVSAVVERVCGLSASDLDHTTTFNDLGFDSLMMVQLSETLASTLDLHVPYRALYDELSTIEKLEALLQDGGGHRQAAVAAFNESGSTSNLMPLKTSGSRPPVVLVHANYVEKLLPRHVDPEQPVIGFFPQGSDGEQVKLTSIEAIAAKYLSELLITQPHGPYYLCGYSFGGVVAYEMAYQLRRRGEHVGHLILIDTPSPYLRPPEDRRPYPIRQADRVRKALPWVAKRVMARAVAKAHIAAGQPVPAEQRKGYIMAVFRNATRVYDPPPLDCPVTLYHASQSVFLEPDRGWRRFVTGAFRAIEVRGDHESIPHSEDLSRRIAEQLDAFDVERRAGQPGESA